MGSVGGEGTADLFHEVSVLQDVEGLLGLLPVLGTDDDEVCTAVVGDFEGVVSVNDAIDAVLEVVAKLFEADAVHLELGSKFGL